MNDLQAKILKAIKAATIIVRHTQLGYGNRCSVTSYRINPRLQLEVPNNGCPSMAVFIDGVEVNDGVDRDTTVDAIRDREKEISVSLIDSL